MCGLQWRLLKKNWHLVIGNDLIDLQRAAIESNWNRKGYLEKICTPDEQQLIREAEDPSAMLWLIWSMKESAYKILNRLTATRSYAPLSFACTDLLTDQNETTGQVRHPQGNFFTQSQVKGHLIHSVAVLEITHFPEISVFEMKNIPGYIEHFNQCPDNYSLERNEMGLPEMTHLLTGKKHAVSVSHHGRYLAIAYSGSPLSAG